MIPEQSVQPRPRRSRRLIVPGALPGLIAAALIGILALGSSSRADEEPSVLVKTMMPERGELPRVVTAYGLASPAQDAVTSIGVQYDGQVAELSVAPGQTVRAGDKLARVTASAAMLAAFDQAQTALRLAQVELAHVTQMRGQQLATRDQVAQAEKAETDARTQVDTLKRQGVDGSAKPVRAPADGTVRSVMVAQGDRIQANAPLLTLVRAGGIVLTAGIEPAARTLVRPGQPVTMTAMPEDGPPIPGQVQTIGGQVDPGTRLVPVRIAGTGGQTLLDGQNLRAAIVVDQLSGWKLPRSAVLTDDQGEHVFQEEGGKAKRINVHILVDAGDTVLVDGALQADRKLVIDGAYQLSEGMAVR